LEISSLNWRQAWFWTGLGWKVRVSREHTLGQLTASYESSIETVLRRNVVNHVQNAGWVLILQFIQQRKVYSDQLVNYLTRSQQCD